MEKCQLRTYLSDLSLLIIGWNIFWSRLKQIDSVGAHKMSLLTDLSVEEVEAPAPLSDPRVVREERLWLNLYSRLELPSRVLCLTILLRREPRVETVPRVDTVDMSGLEEGLLSPWAHRGRSLMVLLLARE